jgi:hypothetical protein
LPPADTTITPQRAGGKGTEATLSSCPATHPAVLFADVEKKVILFFDWFYRATPKKDREAISTMSIYVIYCRFSLSFF